MPAPLLEEARSALEDSTGGGTASALALQALLDGYLRAFQNRDGANGYLALAVWEGRIRERVFSRPGSGRYVSDLQAISANAGRSPEAIYQLAMAMQRTWENRYALARAPARAARLETAATSGAVAGIAAGTAVAVALRVRPDQVPRLFSLARRALPVLPLAGAGIATAGTQGWNLHRAHSLPPAPAQIMDLGVREDQYHYDRGSDTSEIFALTASAGVAALASFHPVALVGSVVIGVAIDQGTEQWNSRRLRSRLTGAARLFQNARRSNDRAALFGAADAVTEATLPLVTYLGENRPQSVAALRRAGKYRVLRHLLANGEDSASSLEGRDSLTAQRQLRAFQAWLSEWEGKLGKEIPQTLREQNFLRWMRSVVEQEEARHLLELRRKGFGTDPVLNQLRAISLLRSADERYLEGNIDALMNQLHMQLNLAILNGAMETE